MREYFEAEMRLLREAGQEFAEMYPELAAQLNLNSQRAWDPYVERLLEGTAYLTAQIKQRIDDDIPEICETLLMQLWPHFLRPFPAVTIMQFQPRIGQLQQIYRVPKGTVIHSAPVGEEKNKIVCEFRTSSDLNVYPIQITQINLSEANNGYSVIKMQMQTAAGVFFEKLHLQELIFYLDADVTIALDTYYALLTAISDIEISFPDYPLLGTNKISDLNFKPSRISFENHLTPVSGRSFLGFHLLHEYFAFRAKYLFITLVGLEKISWPQTCQKLDITIKLNKTFSRTHHLQQDVFKLNCVSAINLFEKNSEPIKLTPRRTEYPLILDVARQAEMILYSVDKVKAIDDNSGIQREYPTLNSFKFRRSEDNYFYVTQRNNNKKSPSNYLVIGNLAEWRNETLSCNITALQGHYPRDFLAENTLIFANKNLPDYIKPRNITRPTAMLLPPQREHYRWILIAHMTLNLQIISELTQLKELLALYDWSERADNQRRIDGLNALKVEQIKQIQQGALVHGLQFSLQVREDFYFSLADIYLFGMVLHRFFVNYVPVNTKVVTKLHCIPSEREFTWN